MRTSRTARFLLPTTLAAMGLCLCASVYYASDDPISGSVTAALFAIPIAAIFLRETSTGRPPTIRWRNDTLVRASGRPIDREAFIDFADAALAASHRTSRAIVLIQVDGLASIRDAIDVAATIRDAVNRGGNSTVARMSDDQFAVLVSSRTSDQVLAMAEEILATVSAAAGAGQIRISIGICFCLPNSTTAAALKISDDALRLAKVSSSNAWRSIAEGGTREVTRRALRAPTLTRSPSGAPDLIGNALGHLEPAASGSPRTPRPSS